NEVDLVLRAAVRLAVATLATEALDLGDGHAGDARSLEGRLHLIRLERLDDRGHQLHGRSSRGWETWTVRIRLAPSAGRRCGRRSPRAGTGRALGPRPPRTPGCP